jgi:hypothetical protein
MRTPTHIFRIVLVALLGAAVAFAVSCGSAGTGLIPSSSGGPLQADFEAVAKAATSGNGCETTEAALGKTEQDFLALPASVDRGLYNRLKEGIANLRKQALVTCAQTTATTTGETTTQTTPTTTTTETTPTTTTPTTPPEPTPSPTEPSNKGGGTEAPGEGESEEIPGKGKGKGEGEGEGNGGASAGGASAGDGQ